MALSSRAQFLFGFEVTQLNSSLDFKASAGGPMLLASLRFGFYSLTSLAAEIARAMRAVDPANVYAVTVNRAIGGGTQNRVTITTSGSYLAIYFATGPRATSSCAALIGFLAQDYTMQTTYTGSNSAGIPITTEYALYNYIGPEMNQKVFGASNTSASGEKESVVFQIQKFAQFEIKHEPKSKVESPTGWLSLVAWMIQQRLFEITPDVSQPTNFFECTLEKTDADGKGLAWRWKEQLPQRPNVYQSGSVQVRLKLQGASFI